MSADNLVQRVAPRDATTFAAGLQPSPNVSDARRRILFLQYETAVGAAVNATPTFAALRRALPDAFVAVASSGLPYQVLRYNPHIDALVKTPNPHVDPAGAAWAIFRSFWLRRRFDYVVTDTGNMKRRLAALALLSRGRRRVGFNVSRALYHARLTQDPALSIIQNNMRLVPLLASSVEPVEPQVYFSDAELAAVDSLLATHVDDDAAPIIVFATQTSGGQPTHWYDQRFAALADHAAERHGARVFFVGTAAEAAAIERIRLSMHAGSVNLAGKTDLPTLSALFCRSDAVVTLDSGSMHIARSAKVPTVVIAAAWQPAHEWLPLGVQMCRIVRRDDISCAHCRKFFCATHECMEEIGVADVSKVLDDVLALHVPSAADRRKRVAAVLTNSARPLTEARR